MNLTAGPAEYFQLSLTGARALTSNSKMGKKIYANQIQPGYFKEDIVFILIWFFENFTISLEKAMYLLTLKDMGFLVS